MTQIAVKVIESNHDCYEYNNFRIDDYIIYTPSQEQTNNSTDHDELGYMAVCNLCGEDMPHIDTDNLSLVNGAENWRDL